ncbi:2-aminoadipate transaminase [Paenibacillus sophorae]|uniref:2-aminoadipate transaminase n=1 Tax=Paenibacillus sophorae TaxID=1333845 RepID=A0A1H8MA96_9BACL|nr:PLP-dependent aminotransferase family protein [Paenibacillus sophorae]QWU17731.1 PLP-dependent aminotransferase family protein [Paenibacillus sophorae]SEO14233.1 2-aminoadipate transaminase [Paenibacillus sophorae]
MNGTKSDYSFNESIILQHVGRTKIANPDSVNLSFGFPAPDLLPIEALNHAASAALIRDNVDALHYTGGKGPELVKRWMLQRLRKFGIEADEDCYLAVYGANQGIELAARVLLNPGETVWVEASTYFNALHMFRYAGAEIEGFPVDHDGLDVDRVESALKQAVQSGGALPKFIYVMPNFQNPTGASMPLERRRRLAELAKYYNIFILEDDAYGELRFEGAHLPSVYSFAPERVIYLGTFSKTLGPGLRLGSVIAPNEVIRRMRCLTLDSPPSPVTQEILGWLLYNYDYDAQIERLNSRYRARRDAMTDAVRSEFGDAAAYTRPEGGFFLWLAFPRETDAGQLHRLAEDRGVSVVPGNPFYAAGGNSPFIRLCFSYCGESEIKRGVKLLGQAYFEHLNKL